MRPWEECTSDSSLHRCSLSCIAVRTAPSSSSQASQPNVKEYRNTISKALLSYQVFRIYFRHILCDKELCNVEEPFDDRDKERCLLIDVFKIKNPFEGRVSFIIIIAVLLLFPELLADYLVLCYQALYYPVVVFQDGPMDRRLFAWVLLIKQRPL